MDVEAAVGGGDEEDEEKDYEEDADFLREAKEAQQVERELDLAQRRFVKRDFFLFRTASERIACCKCSRKNVFY